MKNDHTKALNEMHEALKVALDKMSIVQRINHEYTYADGLVIEVYDLYAPIERATDEIDRLMNVDWKQLIHAVTTHVPYREHDLKHGRWIKFNTKG